MNSQKQVVLFLCTGNSIRSQMSEVYLKSLGKTHYDVFSAGVSPSFVHPLAQAVLEEEGLDTQGLYSKSVESLLHRNIDILITLCDNAVLCIPTQIERAKRRIHWSIPDPISMPGSQESKLQNFRRVRDMLRGKILEFLKSEAASHLATS